MRSLFEQAYLSSVPSLNGRHLILQETTLPELENGAIATITQNTLTNRYSNEYSYSVDDVQITGNDLLVTFMVLSTGKDGNAIYAGYTNSPAGQYSIQIQFLNAASAMGIASLDQIAGQPLETITNYVQTMLNNADVKLYSDDPSFYYQGFWEDLAKVDMSIYDFPGPKGQDKWHNIYANSGGLKNDNIRVTKHIAQLVKERGNYAESIAQYLQ